MQAIVNGTKRLFWVDTPEKGKKKRKGTTAEESKPENEDHPLPIDVLTDTIIGFLEKGTAFLRTVANQSFSSLSGHLERSTVELILTVSVISSDGPIV